MGKGFAPIKNQPKKPATKIAKLTPISQIKANLSSYFNDIKDPRVKRTKKHLLKDILVIAILAVIGGAEGWEDIENYGIAKQEWLSEFLELPHAIPSDDTFRRLFERINPIALSECLTKWVRSGNSPPNLALLRRMALNALNQEKSLKRSLRQKMKRAAMNNDYMMTVLQSFCQ
jgi:predicted transposase YbfD/YdcC